MLFALGLLVVVMALALIFFSMRGTKA